MVMLMSSISSFSLLPLNPNLSTAVDGNSPAVLLKVNRSIDYQFRIISGRQIRQVVVRKSNRTADVTSSSDSVADLESAASVVRKFYAGINLRDLVSVEELIAENCVYEDLVFPQPFVGRKAALHVLQYLELDPAQGILLNSTLDFSVVDNSDSDWAGCPSSRFSVTGFFISLGGIPISWKSKKQPIVSLSSAEAEYRALRKNAAELTWFVRLLLDFGISSTLPVSIYCDNQAALSIPRNPIMHERTKHIELDCHFVRKSLLQAILDFFKKFSDSVGSDLQFVIDDISKEDSSAVGVTWHLVMAETAWNLLSSLGRWHWLQ